MTSTGDSIHNEYLTPTSSFYFPITMDDDNHEYSSTYNNETNSTETVKLNKIQAVLTMDIHIHHTCKYILPPSSKVMLHKMVAK